MIDHSKLPATLLELSVMLNVSKSTVRDWAEKGFLKTERRKTAKGRHFIVYVTGGEVPVTKRRWEAEIGKVMAPVSRGIWGFNANADLEILRECKVCVVEFDNRPDVLRRLIASGATGVIEAARPRGLGLT